MPLPFDTQVPWRGYSQASASGPQIQAANAKRAALVRLTDAALDALDGESPTVVFDHEVPGVPVSMHCIHFV
jgi:hypothetical protein